MAAVIQLTPLQAVTIDVATASFPIFQPLTEALDVGAYDLLDLGLTVKGLSGYSVTIGIMTAMDTAIPDSTTEPGWLYGASASVYDFNFAAVTGSGVTFKRFDAGLLRFVRWVFLSTTASSGNITFSISGLARRWSERQ